ncbi:MAG: acyltransferase [Zetaproteobacteria bacterium]|nr:acyltransferase [Zetaproteobacteria bacterium]
MSQERIRLEGIEVSRGIAAVLVVLDHCSLIMGSEKTFDYVPYYNLFQVGHLGVDFFFVLSGFIIYYAHRLDIGNPKRFVSFMTKRCVRIYPIYWVTSVVFFCAMFFSQSGVSADINHIIFSLLLIPQGEYPINVVGWTLIHEMIFYSFFGIFILSRNVGLLLFSIWFFVIILFNVQAAVTVEVTSYLLSLHNIEFLMGVVIAIAVTEWKLRLYLKQCFWVGMITLLLGIMYDPIKSRPLDSNILMLYGLGSSLIIYSITSMNMLNKWNSFNKLFILLGKASYSIYLMHFIIILSISKILIYFGLNDYFSMVFLLLFFISISVGIWTYLYVEMPLLKYCARKVKS